MGYPPHNSRAARSGTVLLVTAVTLLPTSLTQSTPQVAPQGDCTGGLTIPHSNRGADNPCSGGIGAECEYHCDSGYFAVGRHVCQHDEAAGTVYVNHSFFGGRCDAYAASAPHDCPGVALRFNSSDGFQTKCFSNGDQLLRFVARGNYEVWRRARNSKTGLYLDNVDLTQPEQTKWGAGASGVTGLGLMAEVIADAMGWENRTVVQERVFLTLRSLTGHTPGCTIPRDARGFLVHFFNSDTCASGEQSSCLMCTGLLMAGALFTKNYFNAQEPGSEATQEIARLVDELWDSIHFDQILCHEGHVSPNGTEIPMLQYIGDDRCGAAQKPARDGFYGFNEEHYTVWLAYEKACHSQTAGACSNAPIEAMWNAWQGRRNHPAQHYGQYPLLSDWSGYIVHLPFYTSHSFNSDATYQALLKNHWLADWAYYNATEYAGERGRYGLGAGPTDPSCTEGDGYLADRLSTSPSYPSHCRNLSPYIVAGYLPTAPEQIVPQLFNLLSDGETVLPVTGTDYFVLWRRSMLDPSWEGAAKDITLVDFSSELLGLSTLWLGVEFFQTHTNHFPHDTAAPEILV